MPMAGTRIQPYIKNSSQNKKYIFFKHIAIVFENTKGLGLIILRLDFRICTF